MALMVRAGLDQSKFHRYGTFSCSFIDRKGDLGHPAKSEPTFIVFPNTYCSAI